MRPLDFLRVGDLLDRQTIGVKRTDAHAGDAAGLHEDFGRDGLQARGRAGAGHFSARPASDGGIRCFGRPETINLLRGLHIDSAVIGGGRSVAASVKHNLRDDFAPGVVRHDHIDEAMPAAGALIAGGTGRAGRIQNGRVNPAVGIKRTGIALFMPSCNFQRTRPSEASTSTR